MYIQALRHLRVRLSRNRPPTVVELVPVLIGRHQVHHHKVLALLVETTQFHSKRREYPPAKHVPFSDLQRKFSHFRPLVTRYFRVKRALDLSIWKLNYIRNANKCAPAFVPGPLGPILSRRRQLSHFCETLRGTKDTREDTACDKHFHAFRCSPRSTEKYGRKLDLGCLSRRRWCEI